MIDMKQMLNTILISLKHLFVIKIENCLVREIDPERIDEAFEIEHQEFYNTPSDGSGLSPHFMENIWHPFFLKLKPGDKLWFYRYPPEYWEKLMGQQGYVIMRNGKKINSIITKYN